jgi:outer membrane protein assembly factor BamB
MISKDILQKLDQNLKLQRIVVAAVVCVLSAATILAIPLWLSASPAVKVEASVPGKDGRPLTLNTGAGPVDLTGLMQRFTGMPAPHLPGTWTSFRDSDFNNIVEDAPPLADSWPADGPKVHWRVALGEGYASPVILDGVVYILDYDMQRKADALRAFSLEDGTEIWRRSYDVKIKISHGMSRTIPAINKDYIVTMGPRCHVVCLDTQTGDFRWGIDLQEEYGTTEPLWYTGQCPIIDGDTTVIAPVGTDILMMGLDLVTGEVKWSTPNPRNWIMSHSSIIPMTLLGKKQYVYCAQGGMVGVSAEPDDIGTLLWEIPWDAKVVAPSPVQIGEDFIFMTAGYFGKGSLGVRISEADGTYTVESLYDTTEKEGFSCQQQTPIVHDGLLYGILPKKAGQLGQQFACFKPDNTLVWSSGADNRFGTAGGLGPIIMADNKFFILDDEGTLTMLDATKPEFNQLAQARVLPGHDAWGPFAMAGSRLIARDLDSMACIELGVNQ